MNQDMMNGAGYADITAYLAIRNVQREEQNMQGEYAAGDIVRVVTIKGDAVELIIKCNDEYATTLRLFDHEVKENCIEVIAMAKMYADCGRLGFARYQYIDGFIRSVTDEEFDGIRQRIARALGLPESIEQMSDCEQKNGKHQPLTHLPEQNDLFWKRLDKTVKDAVNGAMSAGVDVDRCEEPAEAQREIELLKRMYNDLLDRMLKTKTRKLQ